MKKLNLKDVLMKIKGDYKEMKLKTLKGRIYLRVEPSFADKKFSVSQIEEVDNIKKMAIYISDEGHRKISSRKDGKKIHALIDLKDQKTLNAFSNCEIHLKVYEDVIVVEGIPVKESILVKHTSKVVSLLQKKKNKKPQPLMIPRHLLHTLEMKKASGLDQYSLFDLEFVESLTTSSSSIYESIDKNLIKDSFKVASFFSGMGGFDYAFKKEGFDIIFALDKPFYKDTTANRLKYGQYECSILEKYHIETYENNLGKHIVAEDILNFPLDEIPKADVYLFTMPCVELSSVSRSRNNLTLTPVFIDKFIEIMKYVKSYAKAFVIENSNNLLKEGAAYLLDKIKKELNWFHISENEVDAADFGAAQHRERAIIVGTLNEKVHIEAPHLVLRKTVGMAFEGLNDSIPNQNPDLYASKSNPETIERMKYVKQGENWESIPVALRSKGKFSNYHRRLDLNDVSCAIANIRKSIITHPTENRGLTIRECLRLFGFDDDFVLTGSLSAMQQMVANSVPVELGRFIAKQLKTYLMKYAF